MIDTSKIKLKIAKTAKKVRTIFAADLFSGCGGATEALVRSCAAAGLLLNLVAVNHWPTAVDTHKHNYPKHVHYCEAVGRVNPLDAVPGRYLDILIAGPECTHFSGAAGGRPKNKQSRASAFDIIWWLEVLDVRQLLIENVIEFKTWGPLDEHNKPIKKLKGMYFRMFIATLQELGYVVEWRVLKASQHGDPTSRERFFLQAIKRTPENPNPVITWPSATHGTPKECIAMPHLKPERTAREIIDLSLPSISIYEREKHGKLPLCENTMRRIYTGVEKFSGLPFLVPNFGERNGQTPRCHSIDMPMPTVTSHGAGAVIQPYLIQGAHSTGGHERRVFDLNRPVTTITATDGHAVIQPFLVVMRNNSDAASLDEPLNTLCGSRGHFYLAEPSLVPFLTKNYLGSDAVGLDAPLPTICANWEHLGVTQPFLLTNGGPQGQQKPRGLDTPLHTLLSCPKEGIVQPVLEGDFLLRYNGAKNGKGLDRTQSLESPLSTLDTRNRFALVQFVVEYYGNTIVPRAISEPLASVTTRDRFALVSLEFVPGADGPYQTAFGHILGWLDILYRMLTVPELAAAHSYSSTFVFLGSDTDQKKMIGNSWPIELGRAILSEMLTRVEWLMPSTPTGRIPFAAKVRGYLDAPPVEAFPDLFSEIERVPLLAEGE